MERVRVDSKIHDFSKKNLVTLPGGYDLYKCARCGLQGKRKGLSGWLTKLNSKSEKKIALCNGEGLEDLLEPRENMAVGVPYMLMQNIPVEGRGNLKEGDIAYTCQPPLIHIELIHDGIWLMGDKPFMALPGEVEQLVEVAPGVFDFAN